MQCRLAWLLIVPYAVSFPQMAGNCNGLYGVHLPNTEGAGNGGYRIELSDASVASDGQRVAKIVINHLRYINNISEENLNETLGSGVYAGFLIKSYDPYTGLPLGTFKQPLPPHTAYYRGCSPSETAVSHFFTEEEIEEREESEENEDVGEEVEGEALEFGEEEPLELHFTWPATRFVKPEINRALCR
jgi:hypothetical protein